MKNQQSGFTLIELIMVIVILGILAAFALPKFADLSGDARKSSINGALGAVRSASAIAHSTALAKGSAANASITLEGTTITMANFYPTADAAGIVAAAQLSGEFGSAAATPLVISVTSAPTPGSCSFSYTAATTTAAPVISTVTSSGC
jgi:MSHA pilin protein MshA